MIKYFSCLSLFIVASVHLYGQTPTVPANLLPKVTPSSPEVAAFARYGNYEVNLFNGTPNISIPLYEINVGELKVPISINYNTSGVRVTDIPTNIGTGWSLSAGGAITRKVMGGMADENNVSANNAGSFGYLNGGTVKNLVKGSSDELEYFRNITDRHVMDTEPDIFSYNLPGKSGKFVFSQEKNLKPFFIPYAPLKVSYTITTPSTMNMAISDESGINYQFNDLESSTASLQSTITSSWLLSQITSSNGQDAINFTYSNASYLTQTIPNDNITVIDAVYNNCGSQYPYSSTPGQTPYSLYNYNTISQKNLETILFKNGKIVFQLAPEARVDLGLTGLKNRMQKILIYNLTNGTYNLIKEINFYHSYFIRTESYSQTYVSSSSMRLRLDSLIVRDANGTNIQEYKFGYNNKTDNYGLPDQYAKCIDYWGYYNGKFATTLVPRTAISYTPTNGQAQTIQVGAASYGTRNPDPAYMQADILNKITYPTGGYTTFAYETNQYSPTNLPADAAYAGGLRIKQIQSYDGISATPLTKTYAYGQNESGYGVKNFVLESYFFQTTMGKRYWNIPDGLNYQQCASESIRTFLPNQTTDLEPWDAVPVAYPYVTEYIGDGINNTGKTVYQFNDQADNASVTQFYGGAPFILSNHYHRGQVLFKSVYRQNADKSYTMMAQTENHYAAFADSARSASALSVTHNLYSEGPTRFGQDVEAQLPPASAGFYGWNGSMEYFAFNYAIQSGDNRLTQTIERTYDQINPLNALVATTNYYYDNFNHMQPTRVVAANSKGDVVLNTIKYASEFAQAGNVYQTMVDRNILNKHVQDQKTNNAVPASLQITNYYDAGNNNLLPQSIQLQTGSNPIETMANFLGYDQFGNILTMQKANDINTSYMWGYNAQYPVAKVINAYSKYVNSTQNVIGNKSVSLYLGPTAGNFTSTPTATFTQNIAGDITIGLPSGFPNTSYNISFGFTLTGPVNKSGSYSCTNGTCNVPANNTVTFANMPPGSYTLSMTGSTTFPSYTFQIGMVVSYQALLQSIVSVSEFYYESFEESDVAGVSTDQARTGKKSFSGSYTTLFTMPNSRKYTIQWWSFDNTKWILNEQPFTQNITLTGKIDDVRIYPSDAEMTTYTYDPLIGLTSSTDAKGMTTYYEYDSLQRLKNIKDKDGNILKHTDYHYQGQ